MVGDANVFPGFLTPVLTQLFSPKPQDNFLTCFCRGERRKYAERKVASIRDQTHNHQLMSPTCSSLSYPGGVIGQAGFALSMAIVAKCNKKINVAQYFVIWRKCVATTFCRVTLNSTYWFSSTLSSTICKLSVYTIR